MSLSNVHEILALVGGLVISFAPHTADQKPVRTAPVFLNYPAPPATLEELAKLSSGVIVGQVVEAETRAQWENQGYELSTHYQVRISEVVKPHPQLPVAGTVVTVRRVGGEWDAGDHILRSVEPDFSQFKVGDVYLLFLTWNESHATFGLRAGPNSAYRVSNGVLSSEGHAAVAARQKGRNVASVLAELRAVIQN